MTKRAMQKATLISAAVMAGGGLIYGLLAVGSAYSDAPLGLRAFIVAGVTAVGASAGWILAFAIGLLRTRSPKKPALGSAPR